MSVTVPMSNPYNHTPKPPLGGSPSLLQPIHMGRPDQGPLLMPAPTPPVANININTPKYFGNWEAPFGEVTKFRVFLFF